MKNQTSQNQTIPSLQSFRNFHIPIPIKELESRIQNLQNMLNRDDIAIFPSATILNRPDSIYYKFRQNSDFLYFTGLEIYPAILVVDSHHVILFYDEPNPEEEIWTGIKPNHKEIKNQWNYISEIFPYQNFKNHIWEFIKNKSRIFYPYGISEPLDSWLLPSLETKIRQGRGNTFFPFSIHHSYLLTFELRIHKSHYEINTIKEIMKITKEAHINVWKNTQPGKYEYELDSILLTTFKKYNSEPAYPDIVASGPNACILHYTKNSDIIPDNALILIDAGSRKHYLNTDITRTFPSNGTFNTTQKMLYEVVLQAQKEAISKVQSGYCMEDVHYSALFVIIDFLKQENILKESIEEIIEQELFKPYYMHRTGHWLGYDVHDAGFYYCLPNWHKNQECTNRFHKKFKKEQQKRQYRKFEPGMICTVEPGLYFLPDLENIPKEWKGIGIRIEDNVLVTEKQPEILSQEIPKETSTIEEIMLSKKNKT